MQPLFSGTIYTTRWFRYSWHVGLDYFSVFYLHLSFDNLVSSSSFLACALRLKTLFHTEDIFCYAVLRSSSHCLLEETFAGSGGYLCTQPS